MYIQGFLRVLITSHVSDLQIPNIAAVGLITKDFHRNEVLPPWLRAGADEFRNAVSP